MHAFVFPKYIVDQELWVFLGRGRGPLLNPVGNGMLITIAFITAVLEFMSAGRRGKLCYGMLVLLML